MASSGLPVRGRKAAQLAVCFLPLLLTQSVVASAETSEPHEVRSSPSGEEWVAYIFGYGSLVWMPSASATICPGAQPADCLPLQHILPVRIQAGLKRGFFLGPADAPKSSPFAFLQDPEWRDQQLLKAWQVLTAVPTDDANCTINGVLFPVTQAQKDAIYSEHTCSRERGYGRQEIPWGNITVLARQDKAMQNLPVITDVSPATLPDGRPHSLPSTGAPIVQSYVDLLLMGALQIDAAGGLPEGYSFTKDAIRSTYGWSEHWLNDRAEVYRPWDINPLSIQVDFALLNETQMHRYLKHIRLPSNTRNGAAWWEDPITVAVVAAVPSLTTAAVVLAVWQIYSRQTRAHTSGPLIAAMLSSHRVAGVALADTSLMYQSL